VSKRVILTSEREAQAYVEGFGDDQAIARIHSFNTLLLEENQNQNLISKPSEAHLWMRHIADSAQLIELAGNSMVGEALGTPWLDLGSGPGFPGLVVAVLRPQWPVVLVESRGRRVEFLEHCISKLGLTNCAVQGERLERVSPFPACVISARAFAPLEKLVRLSAPFSTKQTRYLLPKGRSAAHELSQAKPSIRSMFHVKHSLTDEEAGIIVSK